MDSEKSKKIPYQTHEESILIRKILTSFGVNSIHEYPHRHHFYEILIILSGEGEHEIDGHKYSLKPSTIYFISKGQVHNFLFAKDLDGYLIRFKDIILPTLQKEKEGFYHNLLFVLHRFPEISFPESDKRFLEQLINRMLDEYKSEPIDYFLLHHLLYPILILINRYTIRYESTSDYTQDKYLQYIRLVDKSFRFSQDLTFYAGSLGISKRKLTAICKAKSGKTAKSILNERVLTEAKRLILYTSLPMKEISYQLGYKDLGYFSRYFKKATSMSPATYKRAKGKAI